MTNSLAEDVYILGETMADNLVTMGVTTADADDGLTTLAGKILDIPNKQSTTLTISVPLNLEYGDNFNITGSLTSNGDGVSGATIKLKVGNTVVDTDTTDGTGAVSFTQCPVATGTHSFQLVFDGDLNHASSSSSVVTRDVSKETSVVTVDYPVAGTNYYTDSTVLVEGTLTDNDATPLAGRTVKVKDSGDTVLASLTTDSNGDFSGSVSIATAGACTLTIVYEGNEYYTTTSESRSIVMVAPSISLVSDKSILSYADGDSATLTATLLASDVSGKLVTFEARKQSDDSLVETLTADTDSSGIATVSYLGKHAGDLYIQASSGSIISTQTCAIEDNKFYDNASTDKTSKYTVRTSKSCTLTHYTDYYRLEGGTSGSGANMMIGMSPTELSTSDNWIIEGEVKGATFHPIGVLLDTGHFFVGNLYTNKNFLGFDYGAMSTICSTTSSSAINANNYYTVKIELRDNVLYYSAYDNSNNLLCEMNAGLPSTYQNQTVYPCIMQYANDNSNKFIDIKKFKVKML